jgi:hypothetical protein
MPNLVKAARDLIEFIEQNGVVDQYADDYSEDGPQSQGDKLKELKEELSEAIDASTELITVEEARKRLMNSLFECFGGDMPNSPLLSAKQTKQP